MLRVVVGACVVMVTLSGCTRNKAKVVAEVAGERITDYKFAERYAKYLASTSQRDNILLRQQILNNMINEILIYTDLARRGLDRDEAYLVKIDDITAQALLTAYAHTIIADTASIPEKELHNEFRAYNSKATARYLYAKSEDEARELKAKIVHGATFEELAKDVFDDPGLANNGGSLGTFGWGEMEPALDEIAFSIPVGTISEPVKLSMGYAIVKVENRVENRFVTQGDYQKVREKLWRAVLDRKSDRLIKGELNRIEKEISPSFNDSAVAELFKNWQFVADHASLNVPKEEKTNPSPDVSSMELVRFKADTWTIDEFVDRVAKTTERQRKRVKRMEDVKNMVIGLATREVLLGKARQLGLGSDSLAVETVRHGKESFLLKRWLATLTDTVGESEWDERLLRKKYEETKAERAYPPEANVAEILLRTEEEARKMMSHLRRGADFSDLARKNSIRLWAAKRSGELGFGTEARFGPMGRKLIEAKVGEIVGPERVDPYYAVFKVLEKKSGRPKGFEESRDEIVKELSQLKKLEARDAALNRLRQGVVVRINNSVLENIVLN